MRSIQQGLHKVRNQQFQYGKKSHGQQGVLPSGEDREREQYRHSGSERWPDVGKEAKYGGTEAPQRSVRDANEIQRRADGDSVANVYEQLQEEVAVDSPRRFVESLGGLTHGARTFAARQPNEAVAQIFATQEHEDGEDGDQNDVGQRSKDVLHGRDWIRGRDDLNWERFRR